MAEGTIIPLDRMLPYGSCDLTQAHRTGNPYEVGLGTSLFSIAPLFGLAPGGVFPAFDVTIKAVSSCLTFSPLPVSWRYIFCGTFLGVTSSRR